jgi:integrin beta 2
VLIFFIYSLIISRVLFFCAANPQLLVANRYYIRFVNITTGFSTEVKSNCTNAVAVDFDYREQYIYWSDITFTSFSISRMSIKDNNAQV